jgi:hypothetical protein
VWFGFVFGCADKFDPVGVLKAMNSSRFRRRCLARADEVIE